MIQRGSGIGIKRRQRGLSAVEMAITTPVLVLLMLGVLDFGRVMYAAMTTTNAARAGAGYGAQRNATSGDYNTIRQLARDDATNLPVDAYNAEHVDVTTRQFCRCRNTSGEVNCFNHGCLEVPELYVEVTAVRDFHTVVQYPLIPDGIQISRTATIRVQ